MVVVEGVVRSQTMDDEGTTYCSIEVKNPKFDKIDSYEVFVVVADTMHLGQRVKITIE